MEMKTPLVFISTEQTVTPADIQFIEQEYSVKLPDDYKAHLLRYNGGWPQARTTFMQVDRADGSHTARTISDFYSVKYGEMTLDDVLDDLHDQLHPDLIPFGSEAGGDQFCFSVGPEDYGNVYYISHEFYKPPKRKEMKLPRQYGTGVSWLAPSFSTFLNGLVDSLPLY